MPAKSGAQQKAAGAALSAKRGEVPWEDEKYSYLAVSRTPGVGGAARVLSPPRHGKGKVALKLCQEDGTAGERLITRRQGELFNLRLPAIVERPAAGQHQRLGVAPAQCAGARSIGVRSTRSEPDEQAVGVEAVCHQRHLRAAGPLAQPAHARKDRRLAGTER